VPLTNLVTATATLVYLHSRYVEQPDDLPGEEHQVAALLHKFLPCTASIFAAAVGFAALAVSEIRPIHEMGLWTAAGLGITWVVVFTLFPALQRLFRAPTRLERRVAGRRFPHLVDFLLPWTFRWRWPLLVAASALMVAGGAALFGIPGVLDPMPLETDALDYVPASLDLARDARRYEEAVGGLTAVDLWVRTEEGSILDPALLRGIHLLGLEIEADGRVGSAVGPTAILRFARYAAGRGDDLPDEPADWEKRAADLEQFLLTEPAARGFVDLGSLEGARVIVTCRGEAFGGIDGLRTWLAERWDLAASREPALGAATMTVVGDAVVASKIATYLVPTLVESFAVTAAVIFVAFLVVFRSGVARILAMIPSVFAILVMFLVMRLVGIPLNVATILIASTVLGASENDQIHFFYHFQERRRAGGSVGEALRHAMLVAGRAILFATMINAGGFLALALSDLPPMRQFGVVAASAFLLAALAAFTALPATLWILLGTEERP
jgi:predicted RND superfamily exporter protein